MVKSASFLDKLKVKWDEGKFVCVGLDQGDFDFDKKIIDQIADLVCAYKPNSAFYEAKGAKGWEDLKNTIQYIQATYPEIPVILDAKRGDVENTNEAYAKAIFDELGADAVTVNPYLGKAALQPFLDRKDKGIFVLVKTSNPGAGEFQDLVYQVIAQKVAQEWNKNGNCAVVVGATYPEELKTVREIVGDMPILIPGIGAQEGDLENTVKNGLNGNKQGLIISSSRAIINAPDPKKATQELHSQIQEILKNV